LVTEDKARLGTDVLAYIYPSEDSLK